MERKMRRLWSAIIAIAFVLALVTIAGNEPKEITVKAIKPRLLLQAEFPKFELTLVNPDEEEIFFEVGEKFFLPQIEVLDQEGRSYSQLAKYVDVEYFYLSWEKAEAKEDEKQVKGVDTKIPGIYRIVWNLGELECESTAYVGLPEEDSEETIEEAPRSSTVQSGTSSEVVAAKRAKNKKKASYSTGSSSTGSSSSIGSASGGNGSGGNSSSGGTTGTPPQTETPGLPGDGGNANVPDVTPPQSETPGLPGDGGNANVPDVTPPQSETPGLPGDGGNANVPDVTPPQSENIQDYQEMVEL